MQEYKAKNKYNLKFSDIRKFKILDRSRINKPEFWRNNVINAWCISGDTAKNENDTRFGTYNSYWIGIHDDDRIRVHCDCFGGMCGYNFEEFFNPKDIEREHDLLIQDMLLCKINELIDKGILGLQNEEFAQKNDETKNKLIELFKANTKNKKDNEVLHSIGCLLAEIYDANHKLGHSNSNLTKAYTLGHHDLYKYGGYTIYDKKELANSIGSSENKVKKIVEGLIEENIIELYSNDYCKSTYIKLKEE